MWGITVDGVCRGIEIEGGAWSDRPQWSERTLPLGESVIALREGAALYPFLQELIPARPPDALDCPDCGRPGQRAALAARGVYCTCGNLGWVPAKA